MQHILMKDFECHTYESIGSYPEIRIDCCLTLLDFGNQITNLNLEPLKQKILETVYYQVVSMAKPQTTKQEKADETKDN